MNLGSPNVRSSSKLPTRAGMAKVGQSVRLFEFLAADSRRKENRLEKK